MTERRIFLCALRELPEGSSRGFTVQTPSGLEELFVVHKDGRVVAYRNRCPHTGSPLDWLPDQFLTVEGDLIQCATHDARFRIEDGICVAGPCVGGRLSPLTAVVYQEAVYLDVRS